MKGKLKKIMYVAVAVVAVSAPALATQVFANNGTPQAGAGPSAGLKNPICEGGNCSFSGILAAVMNVVVTVGAAIVVLAVVYAGFLFVTARGNPEQIEKAKKTFLWVVIGAIVLLGAQALSAVITNTARGLGVGI